MRRIPSAAERARWLAEVAQALDEARLLVDRLGARQCDSRARAELIQRIEAARQRTRSLRLGSARRLAEPFHPE